MVFPFNETSLEFNSVPHNETYLNHKELFMANMLAVICMGTTGNLVNLMAVIYAAFRSIPSPRLCSGTASASPGSGPPPPSSSSTSPSATYSTAPPASLSSSPPSTVSSGKSSHPHPPPGGPPVSAPSPPHSGTWWPTPTSSPWPPSPSSDASGSRCRTSSRLSWQYWECSLHTWST